MTTSRYIQAISAFSRGACTHRRRQRDSLSIGPSAPRLCRTRFLLPSCDLYFSTSDREASPLTHRRPQFFPSRGGRDGSSYCSRAHAGVRSVEQIVEVARASPRRDPAKPSANSIEMHSAPTLIKHGTSGRTSRGFPPLLSSSLSPSRSD